MTNLCVRSLVNDLYDRQYHTTLIEDCCMSMNPDTHQFTLEDIRTTRPEIEIMKLSEFMHE
ncbi:isochorismatase family protein [Patescibacteria group bacterium]|nr:isochorismatase family protein [Patescibacteria group bacterium]